MSEPRISLIFITICVLAALFQWTQNKYFANYKSGWHCWQDFYLNETKCAPICSNGSFALYGMEECHEWLNCDANISVKEIIVQSVVKTVYLAEWNGFLIVKSELTSLDYENDFMDNLNMLILFGPNPSIVRFLGYCNHSIYTQYYKLGNALNFHEHLNQSLKIYNTLSLRLKFCIYYAAIINFLHTNSLGMRVMCDSNSLEKTLSQYLLTDNLRLVLNDMDAVPLIHENDGVICGPRELKGTFVAPEQLWPYNDEPFSSQRMRPYDEKTDVWKMPDVCNWFLGNDSETDVVKFKLFSIHKRCKSTDSTDRPTAKIVLSVYEIVWNYL